MLRIILLFAVSHYCINYQKTIKQQIMKQNIIIILFILLFSTTNTKACEVCGCGGSNTYLGLLPDFKTKFIGVRYQYMNYNTVMEMDASQFSHNYYNTTELWGGVNIGRKWKILGFVPFHFNKQIDDDGITTNNGLGDITFLANYKLWDKISVKGNSGISQQLWIGGGIKLPTGKFDVDVKDPAITVADVNSQLGTGSFDFLWNVMYTVKMGNWGINSTINYKTNTDKEGYKFGNKFTANSIVYYKIPQKNRWSISPNAGLLYEHTAQNTLGGTAIDATGGYIANVLGGVEIGNHKISFGISAQLPFSQHNANGQTKLEWRGNGHITFAL